MVSLNTHVSEVYVTIGLITVLYNVVETVSSQNQSLPWACNCETIGIIVCSTQPNLSGGPEFKSN